MKRIEPVYDGKTIPVTTYRVVDENFNVVMYGKYIECYNYVYGDNGDDGRLGILEDIERMQDIADRQGFKYQNEYDLFLREAIADYIINNFKK